MTKLLVKKVTMGSALKMSAAGDLQIFCSSINPEYKPINFPWYCDVK